jgi:putative intracellular protease/amidase
MYDFLSRTGCVDTAGDGIYWCIKHPLLDRHRPNHHYQFTRHSSNTLSRPPSLQQQSIMSTTNGSKTPLRIGVLYEETQMTDLAGLDLLGNLTPQTIDLVCEIVPEMSVLKQYTIPMEFLYISSSMEPARTTPDMYVQPTHTYENAPRDFDILVLGGPNPMTVPEGSLKFLEEASKKTKVILTTCTGAMWLARSGVLDGKKATTNRVTLSAARKMAPSVEWLDQRWVVDDGLFEGSQIWTAGGAGCGESQISQKMYTCSGME